METVPPVLGEAAREFEGPVRLEEDKPAIEVKASGQIRSYLRREKKPKN